MKEALADAKHKARQHHHFIVSRPNEYLLYREATPKNVYVGKSASVEGICRLVKKVCK